MQMAMSRDKAFLSVLFFIMTSIFDLIDMGRNRKRGLAEW
jgi:hypothetical protein